MTDFLDGIHGKIHPLLPEHCVYKAYRISGKMDEKPSPLSNVAGLQHPKLAKNIYSRYGKVLTET
jgi:hypothetical protein